MRFKRPKAEKRAEVAEKQLLALDLSLSLSYSVLSLLLLLPLFYPLLPKFGLKPLLTADWPFLNLPCRSDFAFAGKVGGQRCHRKVATRQGGCLVERLGCLSW